MNLQELKFDIAIADELPLVFDSWARSFQKSPWAGCIPNHLYAQVSRAASAEIIDRGAMILVAYVALPDGTRRVIGYSVSEPERSVLHWLFVKHDYRGLGIGSQLLKATMTRFATTSECFYTYRTLASVPFLGPGWKHVPKYARCKA